jgi:uncharacterized protein (DUF433 family)/DNA-binding transcriptional MerR regulator
VGLIALGEGVYTVPEIARILRPNGVTVDKVRYWLHKRLLGEPIRWGSTGRPHLLSFQQLLKVRTIQRLRDDGFSLQRITPAVRKLSSYLWERLFAEEWHELTFFHVEKRYIGVMDSQRRAIVVESGQWIMAETLSELEDFLRQTHEDWLRREVEIRYFPRLVSNARVLGGSPTIRGTRIQTSFVAYMAEGLGEDEVLELYPRLDREAVQQAVKFEGPQPLAA